LHIISGLLVPETLSCNTGEDAQLNYSAHITWDGTNDPIVPSAASVPTNPGDTLRYSLGVVTIGGTVIDRVQSVSLNFGIKVDTEGGNSEIWDDYAAIQMIDPKLTIKTRSMTGLAKFPFAAGTIANTTVQFRKRTLGGGFESTGQVTIAVAGTIHLSEMFSASGSGRAEQTIEIDVHYDGTNNIVLIS
jgi:hypothetical protein